MILFLLFLFTVNPIMILLLSLSIFTVIAIVTTTIRNVANSCSSLEPKYLLWSKDKIVIEVSLLLKPETDLSQQHVCG